MREQLADFVGGGGKLLISGSELVRALDAEDAATEDRAFLRDVLHVSLVADDADTYDVAPGPDGPFANLPPLDFHDTEPGGYDADRPDVLAPGDGATGALVYASGGAAAVVSDAGIVLGFPLETVQTAEARSALVAAAMTSFGVDRDDVEPTGCGCRSIGRGSLGAFGLVVLAVLSICTRRRAPAA